MSQRGNNRGQPIGDGTTPPTRGPFRVAPLFILLVVVVGSLAILNHPGPEEPAVTTTTTEPQPLSQPGPVTIDATTRDWEEDIGDWHQATLDTDARLSSVVGRDDEFVALGYDTDGPGLWRSDTGERWEMGTRLEAPPDGSQDFWEYRGTSSLTLLRLHNSMVVLGSDGERTMVWVDGRFRGYVDVFTNPIPALVSGDDGLLAIDFATMEDASPPEQSWWLSENGVDWTAIDPVGFPNTESPNDGIVQPLGWEEGFYYALHICPLGVCDESVYRSVDAVRWEPVAIEPYPIPGTFYTMSDIVETEDQLFAVGQIQSDGESSTALWRSQDGSNWSYTEAGDALAPRSVTVRLVSVADGVASIAVDAVEYDVTEGSVINTDAGSVDILSVGDNSTRIKNEGHIEFLRPGESAEMRSMPLLTEIASNGHWIAASGFVLMSMGGSEYGASGTAIWLSSDGGVTWTQMQGPTDGGSFGSLTMSDTSIVLVGGQPTAEDIWYRALED